MLPKRFHKAVGRPKTSYLSNLPSELREELFKYSTKCDYSISFRTTKDKEDDEYGRSVYLDLEGRGLYLTLYFDIEFMAEQPKGVDEFIDDVFQGLRLGTRTGKSFLRLLSINEKTDLDIAKDKIIVYTTPYTAISFDICAEFVEALSAIHQMVREINVSGEV